MIIHNRYQFPVALHGTPSWSSWNRPTAVRKWFGIKGALTVVGANTVRQCALEATLMNFPSMQLLNIALNSMDDQLDNCLQGTLNVDGITYPKCLFMGFEPGEAPFYDASGVHGWIIRGRLLWQQTR